MPTVAHAAHRRSISFFARNICISFILFFWPLFNSDVFAGDSGPTAILGALDIEVELIRNALAKKEEQAFLGIKFYTGEIENRKIVVAATGVGKVNAAMATTLLIEHFRPREIISTGTAGAINPQLLFGDIVVATKTSQHDLGTSAKEGMIARGVANPATGEKNPIFFPANTRLMSIVDKAAKNVKPKPVKDGQGKRNLQIIKGVIISGDIFVSSPVKKEQLRGDFHADAVEREAAAIAQVCRQQGIPYIAIRSISDAGSSDDFVKHGLSSAGQAAQLVLELIRYLDSQTSVNKNREGHLP